MQKRRRIRHEKTFQERLAEEALRFREAANDFPPGSHDQQVLLRRAQQAEIASHIDDWLSSPGLQPPAAAVRNIVGRRKWGTFECKITRLAGVA